MSDSNKSDESLEGGTGDSQKIEDEKIEECLGRSLETLATAFTSSAKRWETIVYPSLFAFILLASYGFYLIYNLTSDVSKVAQHMELIANDMHQVSANMVLMTQTVDSQSVAMHEMNNHMRHMSVSMGQMRYDLSIMNNSVSRPMSFMNTFMPW